MTDQPPTGGRSAAIFNMRVPLAERLKWIAAHKEEILVAFVAKYGGQPENVCMVERKTDDGWVWYVDLKSNAVPFAAAAEDE